jgi:hypothetical protein
MVSSAVLAAVAALAPQSPAARTVDVDVINPAPVERRQVVTMPLPLPRGALRDAPGPQGRAPVLAVSIRVGEQDAQSVPALPAMRWPDGSIALLHAHARLTVPGRGSVHVRAEPQRNADGAAAAFAVAPHRPQIHTPLPLWTELVDVWDRVLRADLVPDPDAGQDGVLFDTGLLRVVRYRAAHRIVDGEHRGRGLFDLRAYLSTADGERGAELTLLLDNQEPSVGPLGAARFRGFRLCVADGSLRMVPAFAVENLLPAPLPRDGGGFVQWLLAPDDALHLGDGTAKAFRVHLFQDSDTLTDDERESARWAPMRCVALPALDDVRNSGAFGAHGGPAPQLPSDPGQASAMLMQWQRFARWGPFGGFGDPENGGISGAPRNGDSMLHNVLRWRSPELLSAAEAMVLQHPLRPTAGRRERAPADTAAYREGMRELAQAAPHGFTQPDYEHAAPGLLFDYWWLTGDALARDELLRLGRGIAALLPTVQTRTSRGEGLCLEALVVCARATGDAALLEGASRHARAVLLPLLAKAPPHIAIAQPPLPLVLDGALYFDAPWEMALLVRGLAALQRETGAADLLPPIAAIADAMAGPCWIEGDGPKSFVSASDAGRYSVVAPPVDRAGCDRMTIGAFELAAELAGDPAVAARLRARARFLLDRELPADAGLPERSFAGANPWLQIALDRQQRTK